MAAVGYTGGDPNKVSKAGDTMTGALVLPGDPTTALQAADKAYVDAHSVGGNPSSTVVAETTYGQASTAGVAAPYSRGDHTHGSPALSSSAASTSAVGDAATVGTATIPARADHAHGRESFGAVTPQTAFGSASANGAASTLARSDHAHGTPAAPSVPAAASTVTDETTYAVAKAVGTAGTFAREDHTHGSPALAGTAPATTLGIGQAAALGSAAAPSRADHVHPLAGSAVAGNSAVGDAAVTGVATTFSTSDHRHGRESFGSATAQTSYGASATDGTATTVSHSDHAHGTPVLTSNAPTTSAVADAAAVGVATAPARADHTHGREAFAVAGTSAVGDSASAGVAATVSRSDHRHGREAFGAVTAQTTFGSASTSGAATTPGRSDHTHGTPTHLGTDHSTIKVSDLASPSAAVDFGAQRLTNLAAATAASDALNRAALNTYLATPDQQGWLAWNYDPVYCSAASNLTSQTIAVAKLILPVGITVTNIAVYIVNSGATLTAGQSLLALYDSGGTQRAVSADQSASWTTAGLKTTAMVTPFAAAAGTYYVAILCNGTTPAGPARTNSSGAIIANAGLSAANFRFGIAATAQTSMPATITPSGFTAGAGAQGFWCAVS